jgi:hypothetical protein
MLTRESYVKYNSRMLVQGNVGRVTKLGVGIGERGRGLGVVRTYLSEIITLRFVTLPLVIPHFFAPT